MRNIQRIGIAALILVMAASTCVPMAEASVTSTALSFREVVERGSANALRLEMAGGEGLGPIYVDDAVLLSGADVTCVGLAGAPDDAPADGPNVRLVFDGAQQEELVRVTTAHVGRRLALVLNGKVLMAPTLRDPITSGEVVVYGETGWDAAALRDAIHRDAGTPLCTN